MSIDGPAIVIKCNSFVNHFDDSIKKHLHAECVEFGQWPIYTRHIVEEEKKTVNGDGLEMILRNNLR